MPSRAARDRIARPPAADTPELVVSNSSNQQNHENQRVPDLVRDSRLTTSFLPSGATQHTVCRVSHQSRHRRPAPINETWFRQQELGNGSFGCVWLEKCSSGPATGRLWAVKEMRKDPLDVRHRAFLN
ncbi:hypothetical protein B0T10DRAFT_580503 [Thelonectria olida]|uniref:Protein kinase domain-containing protein n=1 Tax=Thelonectria olida TaxID=1576542 RepID=A0A9P9AI83_9HYPO|nr:hypothetical protein B0T10DRAFT_580503 [Thelonectria olida]